MQIFITCVGLNNKPFSFACAALRMLKIPCLNKYIAKT